MLTRLALFAQLYDDDGTPALQARLPAVHSVQIVEVLRQFAEQPRRLGDLAGQYISMEMWHETNALDKTGTIEATNRFPESPAELDGLWPALLRWDAALQDARATHTRRTSLTMSSI